MKRTLGWVIGAALMASALVLGGCVADASDEEETTAQSGAALVIQPELPKQQGGAQDPSEEPPVPSPVNQPGNSQGDAPNVDPEPSPWDVGRSAR
jgi:hypothetical protein